MKKIKFLFLIFLFIFSCNKNYEYEDFIDYQINVLDLYNMDGDYEVYFYQDNCSHCENIKNKIFNYAYKLNKKEDYKFYFCNVIKKSDTYYFKDGDKERNELIDEMKNNSVSSLEETYFFGTPSLYIIKDNYQNQQVNEELEKYKFINCLLLYLDPEAMRFSCISRWQQPQLKDIQLLSLNILLNKRNKLF